MVKQNLPCSVGGLGWLLSRAGEFLCVSMIEVASNLNILKEDLISGLKKY